VDETPAYIDTEMINLSGVALGRLASLPPEALQPAQQQTVHQVGIPRHNQGSSGPPGRVD
jgi:hypothetical protein